MKAFIPWCFMIAVLAAPAKADDGLSVGEIIAIILGAGILGTVLYCCCMYYLCRCCWLVCNKDSVGAGPNLTMVQQSQSTAPSAQPIIFAERNPVPMGLIQMPCCGNMGSSQVPGCGNMGSSQVPGCGNMGSSQVPGCGNMGSSQVPGCGNMGSSQVPGCGNMGSSQVPGCGNMRSSQVPGCGNMGSNGIDACGNMYSSQEPECADTIQLIPPPPYKV